ncbi:MAG: efflux RND transporter periplasmic adaptor subunit [Bacteroidia bacterium]
MKIISKSLPFISIILLLNACSNESAKKEVAGNSLNVEGFVTRTESFNNKTQTTADLLANEQVEIKTPLSGQVMEIFFKEGESVTKGKLLVRMDDRVWKAQIPGFKAELEVAEKDYERKKDLLSIGGSSQEEIDNAYSKIEGLKSNLEQLYINIDLANIKAPFSGQLGMRNFSKGAFLNQGDLITTLTQTNLLKLNFTLAQNHKNSIQIGKKIKVLIGTDTFNAEVYAINPQINAQSRTLQIRAILEQSKNKTILPGTFAEVLMSSESVNDAILIPTEAVIPSLNEQTVYISMNGKAKRKVVELGNRNADKVHIIKGLNVGDTLICTGLLQIKDGMPINVQSLKK